MKFERFGVDLNSAPQIEFVIYLGYVRWVSDKAW